MLRKNIEHMEREMMEMRHLVENFKAHIYTLKEQLP